VDGRLPVTWLDSGWTGGGRPQRFWQRASCSLRPPAAGSARESRCQHLQQGRRRHPTRKKIRKERIGVKAGRDPGPGAAYL